MKTTRRKFIKKSFLATLASFLVPGLLLKNDVEASGIFPLNYKPNPKEWSDNEVTLAWIGHSTILINFFGKWIITDPVLKERIGLYFFGTSIGPSRLTPPALSFDEIPKPDLILLSHAHMDHMDYPTLCDFADKYPNQIDVITAYLTQDVIENLPWRSLHVMDWNDNLDLHDINFTALEVEHFGWRYPWEKDRSRGYMKDGRSYNAYFLKRKNKSILFGGDTRKHNKLEIIKNENVDIALMPIGAYDPWIHNHCSPEQALEMAGNINAKYFIPMHTKTFQQSKEPFNEPIDRLLAASSKYSPKIGLEEIGQTFKFNS